MEQSNILKTFFKYVSLNILGMIGLSCCILTDTFFISQGIGANGLTLSSVELPSHSFIISSLRGFAAIIPIVFLLSHYLGMTGVWLSYPCAELVTFLFSFVFLFHHT